MKGAKMKAIVAAMIFTLLAVCPACMKNTDAVEDRPKITVSGEAIVNVKPDKIVITFGIETWDADILVAKRKNNDILKKALAVIKESGVPEKEVQTDHLSIEPRYRGDYRKEKFIGYFVRNTLVVTLTEAGRVEEVATKVLQSGVNYIHGIDFQTTDFGKYREQARELALRAAREKAKKMTAVLGQSLGSPVQINENFSGSPWRYYSTWSGWGYGRGQAMSQNVVQNIQDGSGEMTETIALGKISIQANVTVTFEMKP
jgi:hypothetical protein